MSIVVLQDLVKEKCKEKPQDMAAECFSCSDTGLLFLSVHKLHAWVFKPSASKMKSAVEVPHSDNGSNSG